MTASPALRKRDWIRYQRKSDKRVLEGFIQEISPDQSRLKIGKSPDRPDAVWYDLVDLVILQHQAR